MESRAIPVLDILPDKTSQKPTSTFIPLFASTSRLRYVYIYVPYPFTFFLLH